MAINNILNFIKIFLANFLTTSLVLAIYFHRLVIEGIKNHTSDISILADIVAIVGIVGIGIAVSDYFTKKRDARRHALITLHETLTVIKTWSSYDKDGYDKSKKSEIVTPEVEKIWKNPFSSVFNIDNSALQSLWLNPGLTLLPDEIIERLASFNQEVANFNSYIGMIEGFKYGIDAKTTVSIHLKLNGVITTPLNQTERWITLKLLEFNEFLHFDYIGDGNSGRLHQKHKELYDLVNRYLN